MPAQNRVKLFQFQTLWVIATIFFSPIHMRAFGTAHFNNNANAFFLCHRFYSLKIQPYPAVRLFDKINRQSDESHLPDWTLKLLQNGDFCK
jgi:hypothetical protein